MANFPALQTDFRDFFVSVGTFGKIIQHWTRSCQEQSALLFPGQIVSGFPSLPADSVPSSPVTFTVKATSTFLQHYFGKWQSFLFVFDFIWLVCFSILLCSQAIIFISLLKTHSFSLKRFGWPSQTCPGFYLGQPLTHLDIYQKSNT